jgi:hypothetical protein
MTPNLAAPIMPSLHEAQTRHAAFYAEALRQYEALCAESDHRRGRAVELLSDDWDNIHTAQSWRERHAPGDVDIFERLGAPEAAEVRAQLNEWQH